MNKLTLTDKQLEFLKDILIEHCDEGPQGFGWGSDELIELRDVINEQANP